MKNLSIASNCDIIISYIKIAVEDVKRGCKFCLNLKLYVQTVKLSLWKLPANGLLLYGRQDE